jgi:hypothetical protein
MSNTDEGLAIVHVDGEDNDRLLQRDPATGRWRQATTVTSFSKLAVLPSGYFWVGGTLGRLQAGTAPSSMETILREREPHHLGKLMLHDQNNGWALLSRENHMRRTTNGGEEWHTTIVDYDPANYPVDAVLAGPNHCYVLTRLGRVMETRAGGAEWETIHDLGEDVDPERSSIHLFGSHLYVFGGRKSWTTVPPRGPAEATVEAEPARPVLADRLLTWSAEGAWAGDGVDLTPGTVRREAVFRVQWDPRNAKKPGNLLLQMRLPEEAGPLPLLARLRPADWWATHETGTGDWGVAFTPTVRGTYEYRFFGTNEDGAEVTGEPTEWRTWTVE